MASMTDTTIAFRRWAWAPPEAFAVMARPPASLAAPRPDVRDGFPVLLGEIEEAPPPAEPRHGVDDLRVHVHHRSRRKRELERHHRARRQLDHRIEERAAHAEVADLRVERVPARPRGLDLARKGNPLRPPLLELGHGQGPAAPGPGPRPGSSRHAPHPTPSRKAPAGV